MKNVRKSKMRGVEEGAGKEKNGPGQEAAYSDALSVSNDLVTRKTGAKFRS